MTQLSPALGRRAVRLAAPAWFQKYGVYTAVAALLVYNAAFTDHFLTAANLRTQLVQVAPVVIVALGMALVIGTEGVDLSVGSTMALAAALLPLYLGYGIVPALLVALVAGVVVGAVNGTLVAVVGLQPIVATLALFVGGRGLALVMADGQLKQIENADLLALGSGEVLGIPDVVLIAGVLALVVAGVVHRTTFAGSWSRWAATGPPPGSPDCPSSASSSASTSCAASSRPSPACSPRPGSPRATPPRSATSWSCPRSPRWWSAAPP